MASGEVVATYGAAWNETNEAARRKLLQQSWADDGVYCDPTATVAGRDALEAHIAGFHSRYPGGSIRLTSGIDEYNGWFRFAWSLDGAEGASLIEGFDVGELGPDGRIKRIVGFFGPFPPLAD